MLPSPIKAADCRSFTTFFPLPDHGRSPAPPTTMDQVWGELSLQEIGVPAAAAARRPSPATVLSLNSTPDLFFPTDDHHDDGPRVGGGSFDALASSVLAPFGKKRPPESGKGDRRYKRMMKNRESASRSRARKQAYVSGLQIKIANLVEENDQLKDELNNLAKQQAESCAHKLPRKNPLSRTMTAPF
ncbi:hypothetical protein V2J09_021523 [Rumex salicifolius]